MFLTKQGRRWVRVQQKRKVEAVVSLDALSQAFRKLLNGLCINSHRNFYTLRHNFETWAGESKDRVAVDFIMGHVGRSMGAVYGETISDSRLLTVVNTVRAGPSRLIKSTFGDHIRSRTDNGDEK